MLPATKILAAITLIGTISACGTTGSCDEFAAPHDRAPNSCPIKHVAAPPTPADQPNPNAVRYCYSSLAQVDCFAQPQPGRAGYMGSYQPGQAPPPPVAPAAPLATSP